ncbi:MAG: hypothetical protein N2B03_03525 [Boseongicola sp.]
MSDGVGQVDTVSVAQGLDRLSLHAIRVTEHTIWLVGEAVDTDGMHGFGEATCSGLEQAVASFFIDAAGRRLRERLGTLPEPDCLARAAAWSGIDQAVADLAARQSSQSLSEYLGLGPAGGHPVSLYANINRGTTDRSPEGFANRARRAAGDGFTAVKIAPFVMP